jgi:DNA-binding XRE family transcriptional regulator
VDIGKKLQAIRKAHGLSHRELAARAGLTNGTVSLIKQNKTSASSWFLTKTIVPPFFRTSKEHAPVINAWHTRALQNIWMEPRHLTFAQPVKTTHNTP